MKPGELYVDLDALLDTRLGLLSIHYPEAFQRCFHSDEYFLRDEDDFTPWGGPDRETFRALFEKRDIEVAQSSVMTAVPLMVKNLLGILERDFDETPYLKNVGLTVNIWPYVFDEEETEMLSKIMMVYGGVNTIPTVIRLSPEKLTPEYIVARYTGMIMYEFRSWLALQMENLKPMVMHNVSFIAPALIHGVRASGELLQEGGLKADANIHQLTEAALREFLFLENSPALFFSVYRPDLIETYFPKKA